MEPMHRYQERGVERFLKDKRVFFAVDMGLGKTRICLEAIKRLGKKTLVVAPLRVCYSTWPSEIEKWAPGLSYSIIHGDKLTAARRDVDVQIINYEGLKWLYQKMYDRVLPRRAWPVVILDESSMIKSRKSARFKILKAFGDLLGEFRANLSATPVPNGYHELWTQVYMLDGGAALGKTFSAFQDKYFHYTGPPRYDLYLREGAAEAIHKAIEHLFFRLDANDYLELPELMRQEVPFDMPVDVLAKYKEFKKEAIVELTKDFSISAVSAGVACGKLRQIAQGAVYHPDGKTYTVLHKERLSALQALVEEAEGSPVLVACQFKFEVAMIKEAFGEIPVIAGGCDAPTAARHIALWNAGKLPLMVCHPASISHGVNLQAGGHIIVWYGIPWSLEQYWQLMGRLHRQGQKHAVVVWHLTAKGTIDKRVMQVLGTKDQTQSEFLEAIKCFISE